MRTSYSYFICMCARVACMSVFVPICTFLVCVRACLCVYVRVFECIEISRLIASICALGVVLNVCVYVRDED